MGLLVGLLGGLVVRATPAVAAGTPVSGGGSSFAAPEIQSYEGDESRPPANLAVNYASTSSQQGRQQYAQGTLQYAASDIIYYSVDGPAQAEATTNHPFKYVTVTAGGLAFMYNLVINGTRFTGLNLTQQDVCRIFTGAISNWSQLASTPGDAILASVNHPIDVVSRADGAGESYVLSQYCEAVDPGDWQTFKNYVLGNQAAEGGAGWSGDPGLSANLPVEFWPPILEGNNKGLFASGALQEEDDVSSPNQGGFSIGYMATSYAVNAGFPVASVRNSAGAFVQPDSNSVQIALSYAQPDPRTQTFILNFAGPSPQAYFPSTYSYILAPITTNAPTSAGADATLAQFLCYAVGAGQNDAAPLKYAPLSQQVTQLSVNAIENIPGARGIPNCGVGGPEPSVVAPGQVVTNPAPPPPTTAPAGAPPPGTPAPGAPAPGSPGATAPPAASANAPGSATTVAGAATAQQSAAAQAAAQAAAARQKAASESTAAGTGTTVPCVSSTTSTSTSSTSIPKKSTTTSNAKEAGSTTTSTLGKRASKAAHSGRRDSKTSTSHKSAASSTTTTHPIGTTTSTASTTSTTLCSTSGSGSSASGLSRAAGSNGSGASSGPGGVLLSGGTSGSPTTVQLASVPASSSATNSQAYWYLLVGAVICAVGVGAVEFRRRPAR